MKKHRRSSTKKNVVSMTKKQKFETEKDFMNISEVQKPKPQRLLRTSTD